MAADQRCTGGGPMMHVSKIHRIGDSIFGLAGDVMMGLAVLEWIRTPKRDRAKLYKMIDEVGPRSDVEILELAPDGLAFWNGWGMRLKLHDKVYAIGTGGMSAMQAVKRGLSPEDAVKETLSLDEYSGLFAEPQVEYLLPPDLLPAELKPRRKRGGKTTWRTALGDD
jgi:ATP-dependent protease HslVU (ClpYQ) peptidase subunit